MIKNKTLGKLDSGMSGLSLSSSRQKSKSGGGGGAVQKQGPFTQDGTGLKVGADGRPVVVPQKKATSTQNTVSNLDLLPPLPPLPSSGNENRTLSRRQDEGRDRDVSGSGMAVGAQTTSSSSTHRHHQQQSAHQQSQQHHNEAGPPPAKEKEKEKENPLSKVKNATGGILARAARSKSIRGRKQKPQLPEVTSPYLPPSANIHNNNNNNNIPPSPAGSRTDTSKDQQQHQHQQYQQLQQQYQQQQHYQQSNSGSRLGPESPPQFLQPAETMPNLAIRPMTANTTRTATGTDKNFLSKMKAQRHQFSAQGEKTAKAVAEKGQKAWAKFKMNSFAKSSNGHGHGGANGSEKKKKNKHQELKPPIDVFNLPLKESALGTRVAKEREEGNLYAFWMPAIAFRCIEFLNVHGPMEIGIYRIPGSTAVVDDLKLEFVQCYDVDLLENPPVDIHTVSSLLKAWFRSLPDAILPAEVQSRVYEKCKGFTDQEKPPKDFVEEISRLPPYNYYLLKALFAHLRDINQASEINKMNLANLGMVFCSTLRIDRFCFNWLVTGWAECWDGCLTEMDEYERISKPPSTLAPSTRDFDSVSSRTQPSPKLGTPKLSGEATFAPSSPTAASSVSGPTVHSSSRSVPPTSPTFLASPSPTFTPSPNPSPRYQPVPSNTIAFELEGSPATVTLTRSSDPESPSAARRLSTSSMDSINRRPSTTYAEPPTPHYALSPYNFGPPPPTPSSADIFAKPMTLPPPTPEKDHHPRNLPSTAPAQAIHTTTTKPPSTSSSSNSSKPRSQPPPPLTSRTPPSVPPPPPPLSSSSLPPATPDAQKTSWLASPGLSHDSPDRAAVGPAVGPGSPEKYKLARIDTHAASLAPLLPEIAPISPLMGTSPGSA